jgi:2-oxo-4-hydroxy-4-carboxy-5-ureidoimidazoline decarboxylase
VGDHRLNTVYHRGTESIREFRLKACSTMNSDRISSVFSLVETPLCGETMSHDPRRNSTASPKTDATAAFHPMLRRCPTLGGAHGLSHRPYESLAEVLETSDTIWEECDVDDYEEAFTCTTHASAMWRASPRSTPTPKAWAAGEQKGVERRRPKLCSRSLAEGNAAYEAKFGHIFIVCATGKSAAEMLNTARSPHAQRPQGPRVMVAAELSRTRSHAYG